MKRATIARRGWSPWRQRLVFARGMISDDTEHALFVAQALLAANGDPERFERALAWKLRWWLLGVPAGIGLATLRAILKLWVGFPPSSSGVFSAGNGPAMRSAIIGVAVDDYERMVELVRRSTRLTHTDPKALNGALAIAVAARTTGVVDRTALFCELRNFESADDDWRALIEVVECQLNAGSSVAEFADLLGLEKGVTGYVYHTVPVALFAWLRHEGDVRATVESVLDCGGDTDTVGAIAGALAGASTGEGGIPQEWIDGICEWPRTVSVLREVADTLVEGGAPVRYFWPGLVLRNLLFIVIVLAHGFARLLPRKSENRISKPETNSKS
jgi:ADP-ribosylglycohydrolase